MKLGFMNHRQMACFYAEAVGKNGVDEIITGPRFRYESISASKTDNDIRHHHDALIATLVAEGWEYVDTANSPDSEWYNFRFRRPASR